MEKELYGLYDRQIRLFGKDTQKSIEESHVVVVQGPPYIMAGEKRINDVGGEILKNLVLLGVRKITVNADVLVSFKKIFANKIEKINEEVKVTTIDQEKDEEIWARCTQAIFIDMKMRTNCPSIYVCSRCMAFHPLDQEHVCREYDSVSVAHDCLLGAIIVQEWVKKLQKRSFVDEFRLEI
ncbi:uncharacterized protein Eint_080380 [Encephalitozoon intestinalis ATCC 50506]|uniref:Uncharacterized protein n=1 Tax=Encephalitozoon intestinalis (strain ATCC 50506) TaxID=876142 RepID=E0S8I0_ENCIT|nr:uncharacterized protein Eint_080380 [Encephalitozoon intestinalis ATCC 50506]ADM11974.1 hypothetical protein Eint_080380 [Encephalitozoon intestinalis ATCC 50506]UTX45759.1 Myb-like protein [Encephalitozoon intestinalis]